MTRSLVVAIICALGLGVLGVAACHEKRGKSHWKTAPANKPPPPSQPPAAKRKPAPRGHAGHEHAHGSHPHAADAHHHHTHPHPHLAGPNGHHHPY